MSDVLSQLKCRTAPFNGDGFSVMLRPLSFKEYRGVMARWREVKDSPDAGELIERKLFALGVCNGDGKPVCGSEDEVDSLDPAKVEAIAREVGIRCGLYARPDEKKENTPSTTTTPGSPSILLSPAG